MTIKKIPTLSEYQKSLKLISILTPILALVVAIHFCLSLYFNKSGISLWGVPVPLTFNLLLTVFSIKNAKKELLNEENHPAILQKSSSIMLLLATTIVSIIIVCFFIAYRLYWEI